MCGRQYTRKARLHIFSRWWCCMVLLLFDAFCLGFFSKPNAAVSILPFWFILHNSWHLSSSKTITEKFPRRRGAKIAGCGGVCVHLENWKNNVVTLNILNQLDRSLPAPQKNGVFWWPFWKVWSLPSRWLRRFSGLTCALPCCMPSPAWTAGPRWIGDGWRVGPVELTCSKHLCISICFEYIVCGYFQIQKQRM